MSNDIFADYAGEENRNLSLRDVPLSSPYFRRQIERFLDSCGLQLPAHLDYMAGMYDEDDESLLGCCGLDGSTIKCLAVSPQARNLNLAARLVNHLTAKACREGHGNVTVFTKPGNLTLFKSMGFHLIGSAADAIMLESDPQALLRYKQYLQLQRKPGNNGVIVMNANPMTRGHLYLIEQACQRVDHLYVILVADNPLTYFRYADRQQILVHTLNRLSNVTLVEGSIYTVSAATFPSYFIKKKTVATEAHIELDLNIFGTHLAPALGVTRRFVGEEPLDPLTAAYNVGMHRYLPSYGIEVVEIPRCHVDANPSSSVICATHVRQAIEDGYTTGALSLAAPAAAPFILAKAAVQAMQYELDLSPKPGLVDRNNSGAHKDMDYALMNRSLHALEEPLKQIACRAFSPELPPCAELQRIGIEGEKLMLRETGGVNTHKGALFALGLAVAAASHLLYQGKEVTPQVLQQTIVELAGSFERPTSTHGAEVFRTYQKGGALSMALSGYAPLFTDWLPYYQSLKGHPEAHYRLLLRIMSNLDDTNVLHRAGIEGAEWVKQQARQLLTQFSVERLAALDSEFIQKNLSPGGAADLFALTRFVDGICSVPVTINK